MRQRLEQGEVGQRGDQAAGEDDGLAADPVGQRAEDDEERRADQQRGGDQQVGRHRIDLEGLGEKEQGVELARVPDHRLTGRQPDQGQDHQLEVRPAGEALGQRRFRRRALIDHLLEHRALIELQPNPQRHAQ
ncbi:hypothetical protein GALL_504380 [mine drainage metagenome]|uniref:Uncharacterized protein n=1 Tax=mine drainage metagenome TaxID=410659 RepID=A0A1J5P9L8_9ZZZZ